MPTGIYHRKGKVQTAEQRREYQRRYYRAHREKTQEYQRLYNQTHKKSTSKRRYADFIPPREAVQSVYSSVNLMQAHGDVAARMINSILRGQRGFTT